MRESLLCPRDRSLDLSDPGPHTEHNELVWVAHTEREAILGIRRRRRYCGDPGLVNPPLVSRRIADSSDCETEFSYGPSVGTQVPRLKDCRYAPENVAILDHVSKYGRMWRIWVNGRKVVLGVRLH